MLVHFSQDDFGTYEIWPVNKRIARKFEEETGHECVLIQTDWDWPGVASSLGWVNKTCTHDCYHHTDGTVDCPCGRTAHTMIQDAGEYLDRMTGRTFRGKLDEYFGDL